MKTVLFDRVYHIGFMSLTTGLRHQSFEGPELSVSHHPEEWRWIAKLGDAPLWVGTRKDGSQGKFVDYHQLSEDEKRFLTKETLSKGLLEECGHMALRV